MTVIPENKGAYKLRSVRHSYLRSLAVQWLRKHKPVVYRILSRKAADRYPRVPDVNSNKDGD